MTPVAGSPGIPFVNATLTKIAAPGLTANWDIPATAGASRWTGAAGVYIADETQDLQAGNRVDVYVRTRMEIPYRVGGTPIGALIQADDDLTFTDETGVARTLSVMTLTKSSLVNRVRVHFREA